ESGACYAFPCGRWSAYSIGRTSANRREPPGVTPLIDFGRIEPVAGEEKCRAAFTRDAGKEKRMTKLLERAIPRNLPHTAICPVCGAGFARGRHSNRHKAAGRKTVAWSTYCSRACRQAAYRLRKDIHNNVPASARRRRPAKRRLPLLFACVTSAPER